MRNPERTPGKIGNIVSVFTRQPRHVLDEVSGWKQDPTLRIECFDPVKNLQKCCPTLELTSQGLAGELYPDKMGSYILMKEIILSGRRVYKHTLT